MKLLIVKTSSMGDVVHALPALTDAQRAHPGLVVDWLVEKPFAAIPSLHPGVREVLPMAWRQWRQRLLRRETWRVMGALRTRLRQEHYDLVIDLQGLLKSALWARMAGAPVAGYAGASAREPLASWFYARRAAVGRDLHAVERCRRLLAAHLGYALPATPPDFSLVPPKLGWPAPTRYAALIPNASRAEKLWPEACWIAVGKRLQDYGLTPVVLWGSAAEQTLAERIAAGCAGEVPPFLTVGQMAGVLARAVCIVGLDTGFTHLGAAFGRPTLGIYCDHEPGLAGVTGPGGVQSLGGRGQVPKQAEVLGALTALIGAP